MNNLFHIKALSRENVVIVKHKVKTYVPCVGDVWYQFKNAYILFEISNNLRIISPILVFDMLGILGVINCFFKRLLARKNTTSAILWHHLSKSLRSDEFHFHIFTEKVYFI